MRYFFHLSGAIDLPDTEGFEFATPGEACRAAVASAGEFIRDQPEALCAEEELRIEIRDEAQRKVFGLDFEISHPLTDYDNLFG